MLPYMEKKDVIFLQIGLCLEMERLMITLDYLVGSKSHHDVLLRGRFIRQTPRRIFEDASLDD